MMNISQPNATRRATDRFMTASLELPDSLIEQSAYRGRSELEPEEHVLFVLHPASMEKGDLL
jgi:hypothetical protein